ncbi:MAG: cysteine desulfurase [Sinobacteraceae bacterium]|nr:cysteine desulfurase [Nevskiaceae bacterium]
MSVIYLDHAASTPLDPQVIAALQAALTGELAVGNPSATTHVYGRAAAARIEQAREQIAALIGAAPRELVFTSGATESDNLAILGLARGRESFGRHVISSRTEHKAVLDACKALGKRGFDITWLEPQRDGRIRPEQVAEALRPTTQLVSLMHANNETGVVQPIEAIAAICRAHGAFFHVDAAQSAGKLPLDVGATPIDLLSLSAHKMYGPKGIGALYVSERVRPWLEPLMWGGGQERGLRPGTLPTHQILAFGVAAELARKRRLEDARHLEALVQQFKHSLEGLSGCWYNDPTLKAMEGEAMDGGRLPGLVSLSLEGVDGESLLAELPQLALSSGAACDSATGEPSYVLRAQGVPRELAQSTLRVSFGRGNTREEAETAAGQISAALARLRAEDAPGAPPGGPWAEGSAGSLVEGAKIRCFLRLGSDGNLEALQFRLAACPHTRAVARRLEAQLAAGPCSAEALGTPAEWAREAAVPVTKLGRLLAVEDALQRALGSAAAARSRTIEA